MSTFFSKKVNYQKGLSKKFIIYWAESPGIPFPADTTGSGDAWGRDSSAGLYSITALRPGIRSKDRRWHSILSLLPGRVFPGRWRTCPQPYLPRTRIFWNVYWEGRNSPRIHNACTLMSFQPYPSAEWLWLHWHWYVLCLFLTASRIWWPLSLRLLIRS